MSVISNKILMKFRFYPKSETLREEEKVKKKAFIKKTIADNKVLEQVLLKEKVYGKFVKELTKHAMQQNFTDSEINQRIISRSPINMCLYWCNTKEGHEYWRRISEKVIQAMKEKK